MKVVADQIALCYPEKVGQLTERLVALRTQGIYIHHTEVERQYEILGQLNQAAPESLPYATSVIEQPPATASLPPVIEPTICTESVSPIITSLPGKEKGKRKQELKKEANTKLQKEFNLFLGRLTTKFLESIYQGFSQVQFNRHRRRSWRNASPEQVDEVIENARWLKMLAEQFVKAHGPLDLAKFDRLMVDWIGCHAFQFEVGKITQYDKRTKKFNVIYNEIYRQKAEVALNP